jgi:hypothetical protein
MVQQDSDLALLVRRSLGKTWDEGGKRGADFDMLAMDSHFAGQSPNSYVIQFNNPE